ncbi:MAG TPA: MEDS domain-containing protein [Thermoleophilaceae bacterium]|jgi:hypothetical protein
MRATGPGVDFERVVADHSTCPHMAILLDTVDDVAPALASFYGLGLRRGGWLFHRSIPGRAGEDRRALTASGLEVAALEEEGRLEVNEMPITDPPETWADPWLPVIDERLRDGYAAVWWSRFPIGPAEDHFRAALRYDRYWDAAMAGRKAVSLCVYIVGDLPASVREERIAELRAMHDATFSAPHDGETSVTPRM